MQIDWGGIVRYVALSVLGLYIILGPFAYKQARDQGNSRIAAITRAILVYILICLWIAGGGSVVYGIGMAVDRPDESCGIGCIDPGEGHWQNPRLLFMLSGVALIAAAWFLGKFMERFFTSEAMTRSKSKRPLDFDIEKIKRTNQSIQELRQAHMRGEDFLPIGRRENTGDEEGTNTPKIN
jgi:hypothetical protein